MIAFHNPADEPFGRRIVDFVIVIVHTKYVVVYVVAALFAPISNEGASSVDHPLSFGRGRVLAIVVRSNADTDNDIAFVFFSLAALGTCQFF